jgi:hypothetical protein
MKRLDICHDCSNARLCEDQDLICFHFYKETIKDAQGKGFLTGLFFGMLFGWAFGAFVLWMGSRIGGG